MSNSAPPLGRDHTLEAILLAVAFAIAHTQSPLYFSNQNQYLLHGAALAGHGHLEHDWLANTRDPTPLFSAFVALTYSTVGPEVLQVAYFALLMGYFLAARWLVSAVPDFPDSRAARITFAALFTAAHAAILRWASVKLTGVDYPWYFQAGVAAQYLLGPGIQPSAFGVLLLVALAAFANGRPVLAGALAASACWFHSTYLLPSAILVFGFWLELMQQARTRTAFASAGSALAVVSPVIAFTLWRFNPFDDNATHAIHLLVHTRIPHHCVITRWFDVVAGLQVAWVVLALLLIRREPFGRALAFTTACGAALTGVQLATGSDSLALAFPWRISVLLVPVATAVIAAVWLRWMSRGCPPPFGEVVAIGPILRGHRRTPWDRIKWIVPAALIALVVGGVIVTACGLGYPMIEGERGLYHHVRANAGPDDVYLLLVQFPNVKSGRGAVSNTFTPPPRPKPGTNQIPVDLQRFRLASGARIYVDFKSVPYAPVEVEEWNRRMEFASDLTTNSTWNAPGRHKQLKDEGITHVVTTQEKPLAADYLAEVYRDEAYIIYKMK